MSQKELAQCLGISARQVRNLRSEGMFQPVKNGRGYALEKSIQEYINFKINAEMGRRTNITKEEVQAEHESVKMDISKLKLRKLRRELHYAADVEAFLSGMLVSFKNRLMAEPSKIAVLVAGENNINDIEMVIKKELDSVLKELSEYDPYEIDGIAAYDYENDDIEEDEDDEEGEQ